MASRWSTPALVILGALLSSVLAPGALALHVPDDAETWSHHIETSGFEALVVAVDPGPNAQAFHASHEFTASYPDSDIGIATAEIFEGSAADSIGFVRHIRSQGLGDELQVEVGPLSAGPDAWSAISDEEDSENAGVGHTGVGLTPRTFEFNRDRDTVYFVLWAPFQHTTADIYLDVPGETTVTTHAETGNVHLDTWRTFDATAQAVSPAASAYVTERSIHVENNLLASYLHGTIIAPTAGHASYEIPTTGCSLDKVFVGLFNAYREMNCPSPPDGYYEGWAYSDSISSPYAGEWTFEGHHGGVHTSRSLVLAWADVELPSTAS